MIEIREDWYYVGIWFLAGEGMDWMGIVWRNHLDECHFQYRHRYYADPTEQEGFNPFDSRDEKRFYEVRWDGKTEDEIIQIVDHAVDVLVNGGFCGTRLPWKVRERRHKDLCRGNGEAFKRLLMSLPYTHLTTPEQYAKANEKHKGS